MENRKDALFGLGFVVAISSGLYYWAAKQYDPTPGTLISMFFAVMAMLPTLLSPSFWRREEDDLSYITKPQAKKAA